MDPFNLRVAIVDNNHPGLWNSTKEFFNGYFNYQPVRYRVISNNEIKVQIKAEEADSHYIIKIISLITVIFPLIGAICLFNKWLREGKYEVLSYAKTLPIADNPLTSNNNPPTITQTPEEIPKSSASRATQEACSPNRTESAKKPEKILKSSVPQQRQKGCAPNRKAAKEFLRHPSVVPGSSVNYYDEKRGEIMNLRLQSNDTSPFVEFEIHHQNLTIPVKIVIDSSEAGTVKYLEKGEKIEGQPWEDYLPYQEALRLIFLENPGYDFFYVKALRNGKIVYLSVLSGQDNQLSVLCSSQTPRHSYPYDPKSLSRTWPVYKEEGKTVLTNLSLVEELLNLQEKKDHGRYVCFAKYNPIVQNSALWYSWKEKKEIKCSTRPPEGSFPFEFSEEDIEDCFGRFTNFSLETDSQAFQMTRWLRCVESFES